jgi:germacradienol/geosmin synthase
MLSEGVWPESTLDDVDFGGVAAYGYPDATPMRLKVITRWMTTGFYFDDFFLERFKRPRDLEGGRAYVARLEEFLPLGPAILPLPENAIERSLADLWPRVLFSMEPDLLRRFRADTIAFFRGNVWELANRVHEWIPDPIEYVEKRRETAAGGFAADLVEYSVEWTVPPTVYCSAAMTALLHVFHDWVGWANDVVSYWQEENLEGEINNGVLVTEHYLGCTQERAAHLVNDALTSRMRYFEHVVDTDLETMFDELALDPGTRGEIQRFVQGLRDWMAGIHSWNAMSARYIENPSVADNDRCRFRRTGPTGLGTSAARLAAAAS